MLFRKKDLTNLEAEPDRYMEAEGENNPAHGSRTLSYILLIAAILLLAFAAIVGFMKYSGSIGGLIGSLIPSVMPPEAAVSNRQANTNTVILQKENPNININGASAKIDEYGSVPLIQESTFMAPARGVVKALGGEVAFNASDKTLEIKISGNTVNLTIGSNFVKFNDNGKLYDRAPVIVGGVAMVPIRIIAEALNARVTWEPETGAVTLVYDTN